MFTTTTQNLASRIANGSLTIEDIKSAPKERLEEDTYQGFRVLYCSCQIAPVEIVEAILDRGVNINAISKHNETAIMVAASFNRLDNLTLLLRRGANPLLVDEVSCLKFTLPLYLIGATTTTKQN
jgi:hypothetical protein